MKDWLVDSFMDLCRPFHDNGLPPDLQAEDIESYGFARGAMHRAARLSHSMNIEFGVFQIIGQKFARRAAKAWRPFE